MSTGEKSPVQERSATHPSGGDQAEVPRLACSPWVVGRTKRALDVVFGVVLSVLTAPLVVILAVGSAVSFRAWPFFTQERLGRHGALFRIIKLRTLPPLTPSSADKYTLGQYGTTRWGRLLRRTHLDEIPQVWLVVTGTMSLVGPRPEMPAVAQLFPPAFVETRCAVRPGCTGLWQVGPHASGLIGENPHYDLYYVTSGSASVDLRVMVKTVTQMLGAGALRISVLEEVAAVTRSGGFTLTAPIRPDGVIDES